MASSEKRLINSRINPRHLNEQTAAWIIYSHITLFIVPETAYNILCQIMIFFPTSCSVYCFFNIAYTLNQILDKLTLVWVSKTENKRCLSFSSHMKRDVYSDIRSPISVSALRLAEKRTQHFHRGQKSINVRRSLLCFFRQPSWHVSDHVLLHTLVSGFLMQIGKNDRSWRNSVFQSEISCINQQMLWLLDHVFA